MQKKVTHYKPRSGSINKNQDFYRDDQMELFRVSCEKVFKYFGYAKSSDDMPSQDPTAIFEYDMTESEKHSKPGYLVSNYEHKEWCVKEAETIDSIDVDIMKVLDNPH